MDTDDRPQAAVTETDDMGIFLPDGCRLSARVWMPEGATDAPVPAILEYIPYRWRDGTAARDARMHRWFAAQGYACLRVDMRGNGQSDGLMDDEYTAQELQDACDVIAWIAAQPWCSGAVGMMGKSWGGFNGLQTAALRPPALRAVVTVCSTTDRFADDVHFKGGCLLGENFGWGAVMLSYSSRPPDPALRDDWRAVWLDRLRAEPFLAPRWAAHQARDGYWRHGSVCEDWSAIAVPVLSFGGWADGYMNTVAHLVRNLAVPVKGVVGPWVHQYAHDAVPGPAIGFLQVALRWWDRWLKGVPNGAEDDPAYRVWMQHSAPPDACAAHRPGHWVAEPRLPAPRVSRRMLHLAPGALAEAPAPLDAVIATPQHLGLAAGEYFPMGLDAEMPGDQREDDALSVCFDTAPLPGGLDLLGAAQLRLRLSSDRPLGFVVARLCDVAPDGASLRIAHGVLNLCHRDDRAAPAPMPPGEAVEVTLTLDEMAHRLAPGHRLRLALSNSYWPFLWPAPEAAALRLEGGSLDLPVHSGTSGDEWAPPPPVAAPDRAVIRHAPERAARRIERDLIAGTVTLVIEDDAGRVEDAAHGLVTASSVTERWTIRPDDPASAEAVIVWKQALERGDIRLSTRAEARLSGDSRSLRHTARLEAWEGDVRIFERDFDEAVPRRFV